MTRRQGLSTTAIHGVPHRRPDWSPVVPPLLQTSTFTNPVGSADEVLYTRYGNNPNQVDIAKKYAMLEGAEAALFLSSGTPRARRPHPALPWCGRRPIRGAATARRRGAGSNSRAGRRGGVRRPAPSPGG